MPLVALTNRAGDAAVREFFPGRVVRLSPAGADRVTWALGAVLLVAPMARRIGRGRAGCPRTSVPSCTPPPSGHGARCDLPRGHGGLVARVVNRTTSWLAARSARTADAVITVSARKAQAVERHMGVPPERINTVIPNGATAPAPLKDPWSHLTALGIDPGARWCWSDGGNRLPHKNLGGGRRWRSRPYPDRRPQLVAVSGGGAGDPQAALRDGPGLSDRVILPGWVSDTQLEALYAVASLYACPSLVEGFGLPVVDAMRRGVPVLANDIPVLREVGGDPPPTPTRPIRPRSARPSRPRWPPLTSTPPATATPTRS
ncbi:MAG: glycosyltransferase [Microbacterium sp.]